MVGYTVDDFVGDGVGGEVALDDGDVMAESVRLREGSSEGASDSTIDGGLVGLEVGR